MWLPASSSSNTKSGSAFIIHSYAPNGWTDGIRKGFLNVVKGAEIQDCYFDSNYWLKAGRSSKPALEELSGVLKKVPKETTIFVSDDEAFELTKDLLRDRPVVFAVGINRNKDDPGVKAFCDLGKFDKFTRTALLEDYPYGLALETLRSKAPQVHKVVTLAQESLTAKYMVAGLETYLPSHGIKVKERRISSSWGDWKETLSRHLPKGDTAIWIFIPYGLRDSLNEEIEPQRISKWLDENVKAYKIGADILKSGLSISVGISPIDLGTELGTLFKNYIAGKARSKTCSVSSGSYRVKWTGDQLEKSRASK